MQQMSDAPWFWFLLAALAVWRVTHLLHAEDGPFDVFVRLSAKLGEGFWGKLLDCFYCLSIWIAAPAALLLGRYWLERLLLWLALSAAAIFIERLHVCLISREERAKQTPFFIEDPPGKPGGEEDGLLRK
jgi:hypothetical protein